MNKYSILRFSNELDQSSDEFFKTCRLLRSNLSSSGISSFAFNENIHKSKSSILSPSLSNIFKFPELPKTTLPTYKDFSNLLSKLEVVTSTKSHANNDYVLSENEQIEIVIDEGTYHYIKIPVKGKKSPLKIFIKKITGRILIYSSNYNQKPGISNFEQVFNQENFEIRSLEPYFKHDFLYFGIRALVYSKISILVRFGKNKIHLFDDKKHLKKEENDLAEKFEKKIKKKKKFPKKQFAEVNYKKIRVLSPDEILKRHKEWIVKRDLILKKRKLTLEEKKLKALRYANRQEIRSQQLLEEKNFIQSKILKTNQAKEWITLIYIFKSIQYFRDSKNSIRQQITRKLTTITKVRQIQKLFRESTKGLKITDLSILRSQKLLSLYYNALFNPISINNKITLLKFIRMSHTNRKPELKFEFFLKSVSKIQKYFRKYKLVKKKRIKKLIKFWDESKSFQVRRSLKKKNQIYQISVSMTQRAKVLGNYYLDCVKNFYDSYRSYKREKIFISELPEKEAKKEPLKVNFEYLPSILVMKGLIERASEMPETDSALNV